MCCLFCAEVAKGNVTPKQFWSLYTEISVGAEDTAHATELIEAVKTLPIEKQLELAKRDPIEFTD